MGSKLPKTATSANVSTKSTLDGRTARDQLYCMADKRTHHSVSAADLTVDLVDTFPQHRGGPSKLRTEHL